LAKKHLAFSKWVSVDGSMRVTFTTSWRVTRALRIFYSPTNRRSSTGEYDAVQARASSSYLVMGLPTFHEAYSRD